MENIKGRVTIPTDTDVVKETLDIMKEWGADAIRDCDGTEFPQELKNTVQGNELLNIFLDSVGFLKSMVYQIESN